jgi:hypothetical protein
VFFLIPWEKGEEIMMCHKSDAIAIPAGYEWSRGCLIILLALVVLSSTRELARAEPIRFRFDATITETFAGSPFQLPFAYEVGDVVSGKLTFEPGTGIPTGDNTIKADQIHAFEFDVNGTVFGSSSYSIQVFDNDLIIADDLDISDGIIVDTMVLECSRSSSQSCTPALITIPGIDSFSMNLRLALTGDESIYIMPEISADPAVWNSFDFIRSLNLSFGNQSGGSMSLFATVHEFATAPEPSTLSAIVAMSLACFAPRLRKRQLKTQ